VPLSVVADIQLDQGPTSINRYDRERQATVAADLVGTAALGDATKKIYELPVMKSLPKGVKVSPSGDAESLNELSEGFATAITAGLMMVYAVLVLLFGTFLQPITILFSLPLSIGGAIAALLLTGKQLTTPVWIGILMLMGIVTKNAIMLVEFAVEAIRDGKPRDEAIIDAGMKRARPIVMTTIAMAAGMMPSALAFGAGGEFRSPMALAVIGGLLFSTVLSLVFVPAMFMMMDDIGAFIWRFGKMLLVSHGDSEQAPSDHHAEPPAKEPPAPPPPAMVSPAAE
jgi:multidrug efflux pump subunit AcrB